MKKARQWLDDRGVPYTFHDYKVDGLSEELAEQWLDDVGHDVLINKRGTTWRKLDDATKEGLNRETARRLMLANPSIIKRPVLETGGARIVGFSQSAYASLFSNK